MRRLIPVCNDFRGPFRVHVDRAGRPDGEQPFPENRKAQGGRQQRSDFSNVSKYSMVRTRPSSRDTLGSQPSLSFASLISGRRCMGSSTGSGRESIFDFEPVNSITVYARL